MAIQAPSYINAPRIMFPIVVRNMSQVILDPLPARADETMEIVVVIPSAAAEPHERQPDLTLLLCSSVDIREKMPHPPGNFREGALIKSDARSI